MLCESCFVSGRWWYDLGKCIEKITHLPKDEAVSDARCRALIPAVEKNLGYIARRYQRWQPPRARAAGQPLTLLLVDDDIDSLKLAGLMLMRTQKFEIVGTAKDGRLAVPKAQELRPDLVFTGGMMPDMTGWELARVLSEETPEIAVVIASVSATSDRVEEAMEAGADAFLAKPFFPAVLVATLDRVWMDRGERYASRIAAYLEALRRLDTSEALAAAWEGRFAIL